MLYMGMGALTQHPIDFFFFFPPPADIAGGGAATDDCTAAPEKNPAI
jgi:hypothetical protein